MQSYTGTGIPYKALYCDEIEKQYDAHKTGIHEAGRVYGENSIADSRLFAHARRDCEVLLSALEKALNALDYVEQILTDGKYSRDPEWVYANLRNGRQRGVAGELRALLDAPEGD